MNFEGSSLGECGPHQVYTAQQSLGALVLGEGGIQRTSKELQSFKGVSVRTLLSLRYWVVCEA